MCSRGMCSIQSSSFQTIKITELVEGTFGWFFGNLNAVAYTVALGNAASVNDHRCRVL